MLDNQLVIWLRVWAKESGSFMTGKSEFHGRKVGETRIRTQTGDNNTEDVKIFHKTTEIRGGSEGRQVSCPEKR